MIAVVVVLVVVEMVIVVVPTVLEGIYSGLQRRRSPESTAQYFMHIKLKYWTLTKIVTKWLDTLSGAEQSQ